MAQQPLRLYLASLFVALMIAIGGISGAGLQANDAFAPGAHASSDTIDHLKEPAQLGIVQSLLQSQIIRPARTAFGKNEIPLRVSLQNLFPNSLQPETGFVLHLFRSRSSFLIENEHSSRAPPYIPA